MEPKIIKDMPFDEYAAYPAWNASKLKALAHSFLAYSCYTSSEHSGKTTPAMAFGHAVHAKVLEGIEPSGKNAAEVDKACTMLMKNREVKKLFSGRVDTELTIIWHDDVWGECKARFDAFGHDLNAIIDLKVMAADNHDPLKFGYSAVKFGYDLQAAWYKRAAIAAGLKCDKFLFVVLEKGWYDSSVLNAPDGMILAGEDEISFARINLEQAEKANGFGGRFPGVYDVEHKLYGPQFR